MANGETEPKPLLPFLQSFYDFVVPLAWPMVRFTCGSQLIIHGWGKVVRGGVFSSSTLAFGLFLTFIEFVGGICIHGRIVHALFRGGGRDRDGTTSPSSSTGTTAMAGGKTATNTC